MNEGMNYSSGTGTAHITISNSPVWVL